LGRIRLIWRYLPGNGVLLFFDVKPVWVKAYGGRRYTSAKQLILSRPQKTRGKFYLFMIYDVSSGCTRWAYLPGKNSEYVCHFMRQLRRWYPDQPVWVALDQDRAHPCKSRSTGRLMRELKLHWISLPKRSPDDNPVETIFSDVQLMILDNSNDPNAQTTQKRISAHLRGRNRRSDRHIRINYLYDSHKD
jgi:transposase